MATNQFLPFGTDIAANVIDQNAYSGLTARGTGFKSGMAQSAQFNKVWRQSSVMAAAIGQFVADLSGNDALDDGDVPAMVGKLVTGIRNAGKKRVILAAGGTPNAIVANNSPALNASDLVTGLVQHVNMIAANTGAATYAPDGLPARPVYGLGQAALQGGELVIGGVATLMYLVAPGVNGGNGAWILLECTGGGLAIAPARAFNHAVQLGQLQSSVGSAGSSAGRNRLINGGMQIGTRASAALTTTPVYSAVDLYACWASGGILSAGTHVMDNASPVGRTGIASKLAGVTLTGAGQLSQRFRMEAADAVKLKNQTVILQLKVQHDAGVPVNYTAVLRKANAADNFGTTTVIATSSAIAVTSGQATLLVPWEGGVAVGDCSTGLEIEIQVACGAVTGRNFWFTEWQLEEGTVLTPFEFRSKQIELAAVQRYLFQVPVNGIYFYGWAGSAGAPIGSFPLSYPVEMRVTPSVPTIAFLLTQASMPEIIANSTRGLVLRAVGTVAVGVGVIFNTAPFVISAEL